MKERMKKKREIKTDKEGKMQTWTYETLKKQG
jgi:hypothetical protein